MASNYYYAIFILVVIAAAANIHSLQANFIENDDDEWLQKKHAEAYNASLHAYHPNPSQVVDHFNYHVNLALERSNNTRRGLSGRKYTGPCIAENPIDSCWRCQPNWAENRKHLATCVKGFGIGTTGGQAGEYYEVTDSSDTDLVSPKPGTLRHAVLQPKPLWITFAADMMIKLKAELIVTSDKTIDGRGANVQIANGAGITVQFAKNVIIHNIKVHDIVPGSGGKMRDTSEHVGVRNSDDGDCVQVFASSNIWIDHLSMWNCKDGMIDVLQGSTAVTISNGHFTRHDHVFLFGANDKETKDELMQITLAFNHFGKGLVQRMPRCRFGFFHVVNNDYTHWLMYAVGGSAHPTIISQGNRFVAPNDPTAKMITHRNNAPESEWSKWIWRSEKDLFVNGAHFVESGQPLKKNPFQKQFIEAKDGSFVGKLTQFAGHLKCVKGRKC